MRKQISVLLLACSVALVGCGGANDPTPSLATKAGNEQSRIATSALGAPVVIDSCLVQLHEVIVKRPGLLSTKVVTLATANCPTATVTATNEDCGKSCIQDMLRVERKGAPDIAAALQPPAPADTQAQALAEAKVREAAQKKFELQRKKEQLQQELGLVSTELELLK